MQAFNSEPIQATINIFEPESIMQMFFYVNICQFNHTMSQ